MIARWPTWALRLVIRVAAALHVRPAFVREAETELWLRVELVAQLAREEAARVRDLGEWAFLAPGGVA